MLFINKVFRRYSKHSISLPPRPLQSYYMFVFVAQLEVKTLICAPKKKKKMSSLNFDRQKLNSILCLFINFFLLKVDETLV